MTVPVQPRDWEKALIDGGWRRAILSLTWWHPQHGTITDRQAQQAFGRMR